MTFALPPSNKGGDNQYVYDENLLPNIEGIEVLTEQPGNPIPPVYGANIGASFPAFKKEKLPDHLKECKIVRVAAQDYTEDGKKKPFDPKNFVGMVIISGAHHGYGTRPEVKYGRKDKDSRSVCFAFDQAVGDDFDVQELEWVPIHVRGRCPYPEKNSNAEWTCSLGEVAANDTLNAKGTMDRFWWIPQEKLKLWIQGKHPLLDEEFGEITNTGLTEFK